MTSTIKSRAISAIEQACNKIALEQQEHKISFNNPEHLNDFKKLLKQALVYINENNTNFSYKPYSNMGRYILDDWPKNTDVGNAILNAEDKIQKFLKQNNEAELVN